MKRHVADGAHLLRTPEMPALAPIVAFEHRRKQVPEPLGIDPLAYP